eukprot:scaffold80092_cov33-Tisochrysis_lutea.AAC.2
MRLPPEKSLSICQLAESTLRQELRLTKYSFQQIVLDILGKDVDILRDVTAEFARTQAERSATYDRARVGSTRAGLPWTTRSGGARRSEVSRGVVKRLARRPCRLPACASRDSSRDPGWSTRRYPLIRPHERRPKSTRQ